MNGKIAKVVLDGAAFAFDRQYSYALTPEFYSACAGMRAVVPFGRGNLKKQCMIVEVTEGNIDYLKSVISVTDSEPVLNDEMLKMCDYLNEHIFCTRSDAVHAMLPAGICYKLTDYYSANKEFASETLLSEDEARALALIRSKGEISAPKILRELCLDESVLASLAEKEAVFKNCSPVRKMGDAAQKWVRLAISPEELDGIKLTPRQREVSEVIRDTVSVSIKEACYFTGVGVSVINALIKKGVLTSFEKEVFRTPCRNCSPAVRDEILLTDEQQKAFDGMLEQIKSGKPSVSLLYGVTGSGKTQVFLKLADAVSDMGKGVIIMVPEIALTPQIINLFSRRYGNKIAVFHSAMSAGQRMDEWKRVKNGDALIAIGTRSAVFAPFENLGLIIMDEEQEHTYKSEKNPKFHARDVAKFRASYHNSLLCLASATPSVESYTAALSGRYSLYKLTKRYGSASLPKVETVDMKKEILSGNSSSISLLLYEKTQETLKSGNQAILLLNRRGHNTYISCPDCGYVSTCPNCSVSLTYHSANGRLMCHYCGYSEKATHKCPNCSGEHMKYMGIGTQKVAEELQTLFPKARILRLDADSTMTRDSYSKYLSAFSNGEYDIMLGTQMVAKGLDFPNVTLVGVIGADQAMYSEDFRSFERTFSLLTQVVGRAGRGGNSGTAIIQTVNPESNIIELAKKQDYEGFYSEEILTRKLMIYPPYCDICVVSAFSSSKETAENTIKSIFGKIKEMLNTEYSDIKLIILGPSPASVPRVNNRYRYRAIIKCKNNRRFRDMLRECIKIKTTADTSVSVDINPESII